MLNSAARLLPAGMTSPAVVVRLLSTLDHQPG